MPNAPSHATPAVLARINGPFLAFSPTTVKLRSLPMMFTASCPPSRTSGFEPLPKLLRIRKPVAPSKLMPPVGGVAADAHTQENKYAGVCETRGEQQQHTTTHSDTNGNTTN